MPKFYAWSGRTKLVTQEEYAVTAAAVLWAYAKCQGKKIGQTIRVSEVGFDVDSGHPDHAKDSVFSKKFVEALCS